MDEIKNKPAPSTPILLKMGVFVFVALILFVAGYELSPKFLDFFGPRGVSLDYYSGTDISLKESLAKHQPEAVQNKFLEAVQKGDRSPLSKEAAYFVTHRFFDTGNDITEVNAYITAHEELAFLKEAENIYPEVFKKFYEKKESLTPGEHMLAYLAYIEALSLGGYSDGAAYATAAARYMEFVLRGKGKVATSSIHLYGEKAKNFLTLAHEPIRNIILNLGNAEVQDANVVALNQYALTLAYFEREGIATGSQYKSTYVFATALSYARDNKLLLEPFAALNYCYGLITLGKEQDIAGVGLGNILLSQYKLTTYPKNSLTDKIINGAALGFSPNSLYGRATIRTIAKYDAQFETFLSDRNYDFVSE